MRKKGTEKDSVEFALTIRSTTTGRQGFQISVWNFGIQRHWMMKQPRAVRSVIWWVIFPQVKCLSCVKYSCVDTPWEPSFCCGRPAFGRSATPGQSTTCRAGDCLTPLQLLKAQMPPKFCRTLETGEAPFSTCMAHCWFLVLLNVQVWIVWGWAMAEGNWLKSKYKIICTATLRRRGPIAEGHVSHIYPKALSP